MRLFLLIALIAFISRPAVAGLLGTGITGYYATTTEPDRNLFDPLAGNVPAGYLNAAGVNVVVSSSGIEFGEQTATALITADFTDTQLILTTTPLLAEGLFSSPVLFSFTGTGQFTSISSVSSTFPNGGVSAQLQDQTIFLQWNGTSSLTQPVQAVFNVGSLAGELPANAPEPATTGMMFASLLTVVAYGMHRRHRTG